MPNSLADKRLKFSPFIFTYIVLSKGFHATSQEEESMSLGAPQAKGRLFKDIQRASDDLMKQQGIWYAPDEADSTSGKALIRGPENTPYEGCLLLFSFRFPNDYPFSPPKVLFQTSDTVTRFHPNLYVDGKVCLSILGTYSGPPWSGTQSITSVLLSILALLDDNPLTHEPAFEKGTLMDSRHRDYADAVEHNIVKLTVETIQTFEKDLDNQYHMWAPFKDVVIEELPSIKKALSKKILERAKFPERLWAALTYNMQIRSFWKKLASEVPWVSEATTSEATKSEATTTTPTA